MNAIIKKNKMRLLFVVDFEALRFESIENHKYIGGCSPQLRFRPLNKVF